MDVLERIKDEGINTLCTFRETNKTTGEQKVYGYYICTMTADEIDIGRHDPFINRYEIQEIFNVRKNEYGYVYKSYDYKIIEKSSGNVVFSQ